MRGHNRTLAGPAINVTGYAERDHIFGLTLATVISPTFPGAQENRSEQFASTEGAEFRRVVPIEEGNFLVVVAVAGADNLVEKF